MTYITGVKNTINPLKFIFQPEKNKRI